jgi:hypothetical protein
VTYTHAHAQCRPRPRRPVQGQHQLKSSLGGTFTFRRIRHQVVQRYRIPLREIFKGINQWSTDQISFDHLSGLPTRSRITRGLSVCRIYRKRTQGVLTRCYLVQQAQPGLSAVGLALPFPAGGHGVGPTPCRDEEPNAVSDV